MVKSIYVGNWRNPSFTALPYGTKLYLKTTDDIVRECIVIGGEFKTEEDGYTHIVYTYKIAGLKGTFVGTYEKINDNGICGTLYPKMECITQGAKGKTSDLFLSYDFVEIFRDYIHKAGYCQRDGQFYPFLTMVGVSYNYACFKATKLCDNGRTEQLVTPYNLWFDKSGWHGNIPAIDNGELFYNKQEALSHYKPLVITFDDCENVEEPEDEEITISVKVKKSDMIKLKEICKVQ